MLAKAWKLVIAGKVQGVGFRPFVYRTAKSLGLKGFVANTGSGAVIEIEGETRFLNTFYEILSGKKLPPNTEITNINKSVIPPKNRTQFNIVESFKGNDISADIPPDLCVCADCAADIYSKSNRRFLYPFTNCTNCGPRFSIIKSLPYDRKMTTMSSFIMCKDCEKEYNNPQDRRFHAQPNACPVCGPGITLLTSNFKTAAKGNEALYKTIELLKQSKIIALKSIGGYHLACAADNENAIKLLRKRKNRPHKPFAVMMPSIDIIKKHCIVTGEELKLLTSPAAPIVLLQTRKNSTLPLNLIAPSNNRLGVMMPYTPLHKLIFECPISPLYSQRRDKGELQSKQELPQTLFNKRGGIEKHLEALIMTSGNRSDEPITTDEKFIKDKLAGIADYFLTHDRPICNRCDDSIIMNLRGKENIFIRKSRGYVPDPVRFASFAPTLMLNPDFSIEKSALCAASGGVNPAEGGLKANFAVAKFGLNNVPSPLTGEGSGEGELSGGEKSDSPIPLIFAAGAELKNTFCFVRGQSAYVSQYIGDLDNLEASNFYDEAYKRMSQFLSVKPQVVAYDLHPDYHSSIFAKRLLYSNKKFLGVPVQHHHAHLASVFAEKNLDKPVLGFAFDGSGLGTDGNVWGGECMLVSGSSFTRLAHLDYFQLPGGDTAVREIWRLGVSLLYKYNIKSALPHRDSAQIIEMMKKNVNSPFSSSMGRLFDAVAAIIGLRNEVSFEAQAAMELESLALDNQVKKGYNFNIAYAESMPAIINVKSVLQGILKDLSSGADKGTISAKFHLTIAEIILKLARVLGKKHGINDIALSGGVFQNKLLLNLSITRLESAGFKVHFNKIVPPNDGGISLGQAYVAFLKSLRGA